MDCDSSHKTLVGVSWALQAANRPSGTGTQAPAAPTTILNPKLGGTHTLRDVSLQTGECLHQPSTKMNEPNPPQARPRFPNSQIDKLN